jgi:small-conductance mechanosensitive channel
VGDSWLVRLLAAVGLLGLGVSLASQDTLKNHFGAATLIGDRPFKIGDWISRLGVTRAHVRLIAGGS